MLNKPQNREYGHISEENYWDSHGEASHSYPRTQTLTWFTNQNISLSVRIDHIIGNKIYVIQTDMCVTNMDNNHQLITRNIKDRCTTDNPFANKKTNYFFSVQAVELWGNHQIFDNFNVPNNLGYFGETLGWTLSLLVKYRFQVLKEALQLLVREWFLRYFIRQTYSFDTNGSEAINSQSTIVNITKSNPQRKSSAGRTKEKTRKKEMF